MKKPYVAEWIRAGRPYTGDLTDTFHRAEAWSTERGLVQLHKACVCTLRRGPGGGRRRCQEWSRDYGRGCAHYSGLWNGWGDHGTIWKHRETGGVAFIGQPYGDRDGLGPESMLAPARAFAEAGDFALVVDPGQSWWHPPSTTAVIVCEKSIAQIFGPVAREGCVKAHAGLCVGGAT